MFRRLHQRDRQLPRRHQHHRPAAPDLQQAGVGGLSVEEAGTQDIPQVEPALFIQDKWQPNAHLTVCTASGGRRRSSPI